MATLKFADFKSETRISDSNFALLEAAGGVQLTPEQRAAIRVALKEYEFLRVLKDAGEGKALKKALVMLQARTQNFIAGIDAVTGEPGHIWEYLLAESGAEVTRLRPLLAKCKELNRRVAKPGRKKDFYLDSLLSRLADIYMQAGGRGTSVSHGEGSGGRFLSFSFAALQHLPERFRPYPNKTNKGALGVRWERVRLGAKPRVHMWIGGPYPLLAKPWYGKTKR